jgi:hypothetical protein
MTNILTAAEGAAVLRCETSDAEMLSILPLIDAYIRNASGRDWTADTTIAPEAKSAARMLLVLWRENPGMMASGMNTLDFGLRAALVQLEGIALQYQEFRGRNGAGSCVLLGSRVGDTVTTLVGLIGSSGTQSSLFETVVTENDQIQQTSTSDLSAKWYRAHLTPVGLL